MHEPARHLVGGAVQLRISHLLRAADNRNPVRIEMARFLKQRDQRAVSRMRLRNRALIGWTDCSCCHKYVVRSYCGLPSILPCLEALWHNSWVVPLFGH